MKSLEDGESGEEFVGGAKVGVGYGQLSSRGGEPVNAMTFADKIHYLISYSRLALNRRWPILGPQYSSIHTSALL